MLLIDKSIAKLFCDLIKVPAGTQVFCPFLDQTRHAIPYILRRGCKVSGIYSQERSNRLIRGDDEDNGEYAGSNLYTVNSSEFERYRLIDKNHLAFSALPFIVDFSVSSDDPGYISSPQVRDDALLWKCAARKASRVVNAHMVGMESMLMSLHTGGFFGAVLPKRWVGREQSYMRWWNDNCSQVASIKLPESAVSWEKEISTYKGSLTDYAYQPHNSEWNTYRELSTDHEWTLGIFFKPWHDDQQVGESGRHAHSLGWAKLRHQSFKFRLDSMSDDSLKRCIESFMLTEWYLLNVRSWHLYLKEMEMHRTLGLRSYSAHQLPRVEEMWTFKPNQDNRLKCKIVDSVDEIFKDRRGVQLKTTRGGIKIITHRDELRAAVHDLLIGSDYKATEDGYVLNYKRDTLSKPFSEVKEKIISDLERYGLVPYITSNDNDTIKAQEKWLNIQLTPIGRVIPVKTVTEQKQIPDTDDTEVTQERHGKHDKSDKGDSNKLFQSTVDESGQEIKTIWESLYDDSDIKAVYPELYNLWMRRALSMKMNDYLFDFQLNDVVIMAIKQSLFNGNVPGLGKTREHLFAAILRGATHTLVVAPTKLVDTWQDEIENTIVPFARRVRKNWMGRPLIVGRPNVIKFAADCQPERLAMFNLISYDTLKSTPKDGRFFRCPNCGTIVYSVNSEGDQYCPGASHLYRADPSEDMSCVGPIRRYKALLKEQVLAVSASGEEYYKPRFVKYKQHVPTGKRVHWNPSHPSRAEFPEEECRIIDGKEEALRVMGIPTPPTPVQMVKEENMYDKMSIVQDGIYEGPDGTKIPKYKAVKRNPHVKWSFADMLRWRFNHIIVDEILYAKNESSQRSAALNHICGRTRWGCTGTPLKGLPQNILNYINWITPRAVFPDYRSDDPEGMKKFMSKYSTTVMVDGIELEDGTVVGGKPKQVHKINNPELFQAELAPIMLRHIRTEEQVLKSIRLIPQRYNDIAVPMDERHREYYQKWLDAFAEWWEKMKEEEEDKRAQANILVKVSYLINASTNPHHMLDRISKDASKDSDLKEWASKINDRGHAKYQGPPTAKMLTIRKMLKDTVRNGDKSIVFSTRNAILDMGQAWSEKVGLNSMVIDGRVSLATKPGQTRSRRHIMVQEFREYNYHVMWGGMLALAEGMNIPEANHAFIHDYTWEPSDTMQGIGRMLRPDQRKTVYVNMMVHEGTVDEYMAALCYLKGRSHSEGIDYMEFDDFSSDLIPDFSQYADAIVDGTTEVIKKKMWLAVDRIKKKLEEGTEDD